MREELELPSGAIPRFTPGAIPLGVIRAVLVDASSGLRAWLHLGWNGLAYGAGVYKRF